MTQPHPYVGRFAPSPTGPLHAGSLVAALASWLDARAQGGRWLVRLEDVDHPRCIPGTDQVILQQLVRCGLLPDTLPIWQSHRSDAYAQALARLQASAWAYPCGCSRAEIAAAWQARGVQRPRHSELPYPGSCRGGLHGKPPRAMRVRVAACMGPHDVELVIDWFDRRLGASRQNVSQDVGDFVLKRADGLWAYQLAVVVDDAAQGITHIVRGEDLADNTPRQIHLQRLLGLPTPRYLHTPLVLGADGEKLSKQNGAAPLDLTNPLHALRQAGSHLGIEVPAHSVPEWLSAAAQAWRVQWGLPTLA